MSVLAKVLIELFFFVTILAMLCVFGAPYWAAFLGAMLYQQLAGIRFDARNDP